MESRSNLDTSYYSLWICITCSVSCIFSWLADISTPKSIDKILILPKSMLIWCDQYLTNYVDLKENKNQGHNKRLFSFYVLTLSVTVTLVQWLTNAGTQVCLWYSTLYDQRKSGKYFIPIWSPIYCIFLNNHIEMKGATKS